MHRGSRSTYPEDTSCARDRCRAIIVRSQVVALDLKTRLLLSMYTIQRGFLKVYRNSKLFPAGAGCVRTRWVQMPPIALPGKLGESKASR